MLQVRFSTVRASLNLDLFQLFPVGESTELNFSFNCRNNCVFKHDQDVQWFVNISKQVDGEVESSVSLNIQVLERPKIEFNRSLGKLYF